MDGYKVFFKWRILHEYYTENECRGIELVPDMRMKQLFRKRGADFRKVAKNEWVLVGGDEVEWDEEDEVVLEMKVTDTDLWYVTEQTEMFDTLRLRMGEAEAGGEKEIRMGVKKLKWEYLLLARRWVDGQQLELTESSGRLEFKKPEIVDVNGKKCWRTETLNPVALCEFYDYQLRLIEYRPLGKKVLCKRVAYPEPGRYVDASAGCIRQVVYY